MDPYKHNVALIQAVAGALGSLRENLVFVGGFHNRWYGLAIQSAVRTELPDKSHIRLIGAPVFIATKIEDFKARGQGDFLASHDLEDIITIVDGRHSLLEEIADAPAELREYLAKTIGEWLANQDFLQALPGHLPADPGSQRRLGRLVEVLRGIQKCGGHIADLSHPQ